MIALRLVGRWCLNNVNGQIRALVYLMSQLDLQSEENGCSHGALLAKIVSPFETHDQGECLNTYLLKTDTMMVMLTARTAPAAAAPTIMPR